MSERDYTEETKEMQKSEAEDKDDDEYEKICMICRRPESVTGPMMNLPNNIYVCKDCMQKSFDAMTNGDIDYSRLMNIPGVQFLNIGDMEQQIP